MDVITEECIGMTPEEAAFYLKEKAVAAEKEEIRKFEEAQKAVE